MESSPSPRASSASSRRFRTFRLRPRSNSTFRFRDASARHRPEQYSAAFLLSKCRWQLRQTLRTILSSQSPVRALARPQKGGIQPLDHPLSACPILPFAPPHKPYVSRTFFAAFIASSQLSHSPASHLASSSGPLHSSHRSIP